MYYLIINDEIETIENLNQLRKRIIELKSIDLIITFKLFFVPEIKTDYSKHFLDPFDFKDFIYVYRCDDIEVPKSIFEYFKQEANRLKNNKGVI